MYKGTITVSIEASFDFDFDAEGMDGFDIKTLADAETFAEEQVAEWIESGDISFDRDFYVKSKERE